MSSDWHEGYADAIRRNDIDGLHDTIAKLVKRNRQLERKLTAARKERDEAAAATTAVTRSVAHAITVTQELTDAPS